MSLKENCKYYDVTVCTKHIKFLCKLRNCDDYISKYTRTNCKHYRKNNTRAAERCSVLCGEKGDVPCANPRIKKNGHPVLCTFYKEIP